MESAYTFNRAVLARPASGRDMLASRNIHSVGFEMSVENVFRKKRRKIPQGSRITAGLWPDEASKVILNVALGQEGRKPSKRTGSRATPCGNLFASGTGTYVMYYSYRKATNGSTRVARRAGM